jgi:T5SS/PEP-CTERM-associated repeat protein
MQRFVEKFFGALITLLLCKTATISAVTVIDGTVVDTQGARYYLGFGSSFNLLIITNAGVLKTGFVDIGENVGDQGNQAIVTGTNSLWSAGATMFIGVRGPNNAVTVTQGGTVTVRDPYLIILGSFATSTGNSLNIVNGGNVFASSLAATRGSIVLSNGVLGVSSLGLGANSGKFTFASGALSTTNGVTVDHGASPFIIGTTPNGISTWQIWGGENVITATNGFLLGGVSSSTNTINVNVPGAVLRANGPLYLGNNGTSAGRSAISISAGAMLEADTIIGSLDGSGTITNVGGIFQFATRTPTITNLAAANVVGSNVIVSFRNSTNAPVSIQAGTLTNISFLGSRALRLNNSTNESAPDFQFQSLFPTNYDRLELVGGTNFWSGTNLTIGPWGSMLISNCVPRFPPGGGFLKVTENSILVCDGEPGNFNRGGSNLTVIVSGSNAGWHNQRWFTLGSLGHSNLLIITNGGKMITAGDFFIGYDYSSSNNTVVVAGSGSLLNNGGGVYVGFGSSGNRLVVKDGATASATCYLANSNNIVTVSGNGTTWSGGSSISGSYNRLEMSDGAQADLGPAGITVGYENGSFSNVLFLNKAKLSADTINIGFYGQGDFCMDRSVLSVNWFYQRVGGFYFPSGIVNARYSEVDFWVGDGVHPARLNLTGSFHKRPITISSNACLTGLAAWVSTGFGLGGIQNNITNYGTIIPGSPVGEMSILYASLYLKPSSTLVFNLQGTNQGITYSDLLVSYAVQFGGDLQISLLDGFEPSPTNLFTLMTFGSSTGSFANVPSGTRLKTTHNLGSFLVDYSSGTNLVLSQYQTTDVDGDGIDDEWATVHFHHTPLSNAEKQTDSDGDGLNNYSEFLAGTNPTNQASAFNITAVSVDSVGAVKLQFSAVPGKTYQIGYSDDLESWNSVDTPLLAWVAPDTCQWVDDGMETSSPPGTKRFYRVTVVP